MRWSRLFSAYGGYPFAVLVVACATLVLLPLRPLLSGVQVMLIYVPVIIGIGRLSGVRASVLGAVLAFVTLDLLFVPPYYTFTVSSPVDWLTLLVFLLVALIAGAQTGRLRQRERTAVERQGNLELMNALSARLVSGDPVDVLAEHVVGDLATVAAASRVALYGRRDGEAVLLAEAGREKASRNESEFAEWVLLNAKAVALPPVSGSTPGLRPASADADDALPGEVADGVYLPLQAAGAIEGVLYARSPHEHFADDEVRLLVAVANLAAVAIERQRLAADATTAAALREADRLKSTLVSSVSHELKTPLAAVTAHVTGLLEEGEGCDSARARAELEAAREDLERLDTSIGDLLDVSRLESDAWRPSTDIFDVSEILGTVASRLQEDQSERVTFAIGDDTPEVRVDFSQWVRAFTHLIENALAYSPPGSPVHVTARRGASGVVIAVEDSGPGIPDDEKDLVFEKFYRGSTSGPVLSGTGLGLAIAREIAHSHSGSIHVEDARPHGARFVVTLPATGDRS